MKAFALISCRVNIRDNSCAKGYTNKRHFVKLAKIDHVRYRVSYSGPYDVQIGWISLFMPELLVGRFL